MEPDDQRPGKVQGQYRRRSVPFGTGPANAGHLRDSHVSAPSVPAPIIYAYAPRLVIDYEITDRSLHLAEVGLWEVVALFRQVVVDRGCLVHEDRLQSAPPLQRVLVSVFVQLRHLPGNTDARTNEPTGSDAPSLARLCRRGFLRKSLRSAEGMRDALQVAVARTGSGMSPPAGPTAQIPRKVAASSLTRAPATSSTISPGGSRPCRAGPPSRPRRRTWCPRPRRCTCRATAAAAVDPAERHES